MSEYFPCLTSTFLYFLLLILYGFINQVPLKGGENREGYDIYKNSVLRSSVVDSLAFKCVKTYSSALRLNLYIIILLFSVL